MWEYKRRMSPFYVSYKFLGIVENDRFPLQKIAHNIEKKRKSRKKCNDNILLKCKHIMCIIKKYVLLTAC